MCFYVFLVMFCATLKRGFEFLFFVTTNDFLFKFLRRCFAPKSIREMGGPSPLLPFKRIPGFELRWNAWLSRCPISIMNSAKLRRRKQVVIARKRQERLVRRPIGSCVSFPCRCMVPKTLPELVAAQWCLCV